MHDKPIGADEDRCATTAALDFRDQGVVLALVLALHPDHLTVSELIREVCSGRVNPITRDRYERAIHDLGGAGLLHVCAEMVFPSRAALHFDRLEMD